MHHINMRTQKRAFTLIELIIVVVIISMLAAIVLVSVNGAREKSKRTKTKGTMQQIAKAVNQYYADLDSYPPNMDETDTNGKNEWSALQPYSSVPLVKKTVSGLGVSDYQGPADGWDNPVNYGNLDGSIYLQSAGEDRGKTRAFNNPSDCTGDIYYGIYNYNTCGPDNFWNN